MRALLLTTALFAFALPGSLAAQGSIGGRDTVPGGCSTRPPRPPAYPGPADIVPTASSPSPAAPAAPAPTSPRPGAGSPNSAGFNPYTPPAVTPTSTPWDDPSSWRHWWVLNREPYLGLKTIASQAGVITGSDDFFLGQGEGREEREIALVDDKAFFGRVVPALSDLLKTERDSAMRSLALIALAEGGAGRPGSEALVDVILPELDSGRVEVAEAATVALGILGRLEAAEVLLEVLNCYAHSLKANHGLDFGAHVSPRQRAFAAYALGLLGQRAEGAAHEYWRVRIVNALASAVMNDQHGSQEMRSACIVALGLVRLDVADELGARQSPAQRRRGSMLTTRQEQVRWLLGALEEAEFDSRVRSQAPVSIARLMLDAPASFSLRELATVRIATLMGDGAGEQIRVRRGCAQALGWIVDCDEGKLDVTAREALIEAARSASDQGVRRFAWIALARAAARPGTEGEPFAGVPAARKALGKELADGSTPLRPWAAVAVGMLERGLLEAGQAASPDMRRALRSALADARTLEEVGACGIGIGLARDQDAAELLRKEFRATKDPQTRGDLALALGLIEDRGALDIMRAACESAVNQPELVLHLAMGLALLGDKEIGAKLEQLLDEEPSSGPAVNLLTALGRVGASHTVERLVAAAADTSTPTASRAAAIGALGRVVELDLLPWASRLSIGSSYRSDVVTLTTVPRGDGVLDLRP